MPHLKAYDKEGNILAIGYNAKNNQGSVIIPNLSPHTHYPQGEFYVSWEGDNYESEKTVVPEFTTLESSYKEITFYAKDILTVKPKTAYDIAVDNGFSGTEEEWVKSIKGEPGDKLTFNDLTEEEKQRISGTLNRPVNSQLTSRGVNKPMITFIDDDGRTQVKDKWEPILKEKKNKLTIATVTSWVENKEPTVIQWEEIHDWNQKYGVEFVSHTHEHKHAQELTDVEVENELKLAHDILKREGLTYNIIVQPFGENTDSVRRISRKYYRANIGTKEDINTTPLDTFNVRRISLGETLYTTFEQYKEKIDEAIANNGWIIFKSHSQYESFDENQLQIIRQIIDYAREQHMLEVNLEEGLNYMGNLIDTGDYFKRVQGSDYFVMDRDGKIHSNFGDKNYDMLKFNTVTINTPITEFQDRTTSTVAIVSTNSQGFPNNSSGQLSTTKSESLGLSYQLFMPSNSNSIYKRRWDTKSANWTEFEDIKSSGDTDIVLNYTENVDIEVPPNTYKDVNFTIQGVTNKDNVLVSPGSGIEVGLIYNGFITTTNTVRLRLWNTTNNPVTTKRPYKITVIKNDTPQNVIKGLKGDQGERGIQGIPGDAPNFLNVNAEYDVTAYQPIAPNEYNAMRYFRDTSYTDEFMKGYDNYVARYGTSEVTKTIKEDYSKVTKGTIRVIENNDNNYTTEVGTTIEHTFTGYSISMTANTNNQGGMWKASIDGDFVKNISVYGGGTVETFLISDELENREHTLVLEFIGQDPDNPVSSPRGWIRAGKYSTYYNTFTINKKETVTGLSKVIDVAYPVSNKEYAIAVRPKDSSISTEFFPYHGVQTSFKGENYVRQLIVDGVDVDLTKKKENIQFKEARLIQKIEHKLSTDSSIRMECTFIVTFKDSKVYNDVRFKWVQPSQITSGYVFQMPFDYNWFSSVVVDSIEQVNKSDEFGTQSDFNNDNAKVYTGFSNNEVGKDYIYQCVVNKAPMPVDRLWLQHRDARLQKLYPQYYNATIKEAGDIDVFSGYYEIVKIKDANKVYKL